MVAHKEEVYQNRSSLVKVKDPWAESPMVLGHMESHQLVFPSSAVTPTSYNYLRDGKWAA